MKNKTAYLLFVIAAIIFISDTVQKLPYSPDDTFIYIAHNLPEIVKIYEKNTWDYIGNVTNGNPYVYFGDQESKSTRVFVDENEVTDKIRTPEINAKVSDISRIPEIRQEMVRIQRNLGEKGNLIAS